MREKQFVEGQYFHIFNKSIAGFRIFQDPGNIRRFINVLDYYNNSIISESFSKALRRKIYIPKNLLYPKENKILKIISYCIMPDHYHLLVKILKNFTLSKYINDIENSYTHFFNLKFERIGPLWQTAFKSVLITSNELLIHISRYIHLNPTSSNLIGKPEDWEFSSYRDFITDEKILNDYVKDISIKSMDYYKKFVENQMDYQRNLKLIRKLRLD